MHKALARRNHPAKPLPKGSEPSTKSRLAVKKSCKVGSASTNSLHHRSLMRFATKGRKPAAAASPSTETPSSKQKGFDIEQRFDELVQVTAQSQQFQQQLQQQLHQQSQQFVHMQQQITAIAHHLNLKNDAILAPQTDQSAASPAPPKDVAANAIAAKKWHAAKEFKPLLDWSQQATTDGNADGAYYLGLLFSEGRIVVPAPGELSAGQRIPPLTLKRGKPGSPDHYRAFRLWTIAANQGHADAQHALGHLHLKGDLKSTQDNATDAMEWTGPGGNLTPFFYPGEWGPDQPTAIKWFTKAAEGGHIYSQHTLGELYSASGTDKTAAQWYTPAALRGHLASQVALGDIYSSRKSSSTNSKLACKWKTMAAEQGHCVSQRQLGQLYSGDKLGPSDFPAAEKWYTHAGEQGDKESQRALGDLYASDKLGAADYSTASHWYIKATEQGCAHS